MKGSSKEIVLVVDDEPVVREVVREILEEDGFEVHEAVDGEEAIEALGRLEDRSPLILLDLTLPGVSGQEVLDQILARSPESRILVMSGYPEPPCRSGPLDEVPIPFLRKPFRPDTLLETIATIS